MSKIEQIEDDLTARDIHWAVKKLHEGFVIEIVFQHGYESLTYVFKNGKLWHILEPGDNQKLVRSQHPNIEDFVNSHEVRTDNTYVCHPPLKK